MSLFLQILISVVILSVAAMIVLREVINETKVQLVDFWAVKKSNAK